MKTPSQAQMRRLLRGCEVVPFARAAAHEAGSLLGKTRTTDVVDAAVVVLSMERAPDIVSDDTEDIRCLLSAAGAKTSIVDV